jgi:TonB family protein
MRIALLALLLTGALCAQGPAAPAPSAATLASAGLAALNKGQFTTAVYFLKQAASLDPRHPSAWTDLGRAYLMLGHFDAAIDAHLRQIDANPQSPGVHANLGLAYLRKGNREDAMSAFRQQIELDPQNLTAHAALGDIYYDLQRYTEAAAELEKAVGIRPENIPAQVSLGGTYLALGQTGKGLAILDRVVKDRQSAPVWNDVAVKFGENKVQLDRAQQYAESAVTTLGTELRNVESDHITADILRRVVSLADYWDTLGWVHFQQGHVEEAIRFIQAGWSVDPTGPKADHLGQIYQSRGQKQQAIAAFAQALSARRALPVTRRRLESLVPADQIAVMVQRAGDELIAAQTVPVRNLAEKTTAEFYIVQATTPATPEVRFIRGDEKLQQSANDVLAATAPVTFPDATPTKLIRRVSLTCPGEGKNCSREMLTAAAAVNAELNSIPPETHIPQTADLKVSAPIPIYKPEPQYSKKALKAKLQGTVVLYIAVDTSGRATDIRVVRGLGSGLDEKAIEAVSQWKFQPGMKDGHPVKVAATVSVNFRLLK